MIMAKGFSLIELLTTLAIASITAFMGVPVASKFIEQQKVTSDVHTVIRMINLTRIEAIKRKQSLSLCGLSSSQQCQTNWSKLGLLATKNSNKSNSKPLHWADLKANYRTTFWSSFQRKPSLSFAANGFSEHLNGSLYLCHAKYPELNRAIKVSKSGKAHVVKAEQIAANRCN